MIDRSVDATRVCVYPEAPFLSGVSKHPIRRGTRTKYLTTRHRVQMAVPTRHSFSARVDGCKRACVRRGADVLRKRCVRSRPRRVYTRPFTRVVAAHPRSRQRHHRVADSRILDPRDLPRVPLRASRPSPSPLPPSMKPPHARRRRRRPPHHPGRTNHGANPSAPGTSGTRSTNKTPSSSAPSQG